MAVTNGTTSALREAAQEVTTQQVLGEFDARGVRFLTLRMRLSALARHITSVRSHATCDALVGAEAEDGLLCLNHVLAAIPGESQCR